MDNQIQPQPQSQAQPSGNPIKLDPNTIEEDFFKLAHLENLPDDQKQQILTKMLEATRNRVLVRIDDIIGDADRPQFHQILESGNDQEIGNYIKSKGINMSQLVAEEALLTKAEMLQSLQRIYTDTKKE